MFVTSIIGQMCCTCHVHYLANLADQSFFNGIFKDEFWHNHISRKGVGGKGERERRTVSEENVCVRIIYECIPFSVMEVEGSVIP